MYLALFWRGEVEDAAGVVLKLSLDIFNPNVNVTIEVHCNLHKVNLGTVVGGNLTCLVTILRQF